MKPESSLLLALVGVLGGGTLVPLLYSAYTRRRDAPARESERAARREALAAREAADAVQAVGGAIRVLREQLADNRNVLDVCHGERDALRAEKAEDRDEIRALRRRIRELRGEPVPPDELPSGPGATTAEA